MPQYMNELDAIYQYINGNPEARRLIKYKINQIQKGIQDVEYFQECKQTYEQIQFCLDLS